MPFSLKHWPALASHAAATTMPGSPEPLPRPAQVEGNLTFVTLARCSTTKARVSLLTTKHSAIPTPVFMPGRHVHVLLAGVRLYTWMREAGNPTNPATSHQSAPRAV